jgi:glycosyltransferase involved in cell wall biosynthesis
MTGLYPHDILCASEYGFSPEFHREVRTALDWADTVVLLHPFLAPLVTPLCRARHLKIYESLNNDARTKRRYYADSRDPACAAKLVADTFWCESLAIDTADIVLAVSEDDARSFVDDYAADARKVKVVANGVDVAAQDRISPEAKAEFRERAGLSGRDVGVFIGSAYGPNVASYRMARQWLHAAGFTGVMLIVGKISEAYDKTWPKVGFTEEWRGFVDDETKRLLTGAADFALHLVTEGGGTNIKLFDYMASGVPIIANKFGTRGVDEDGWFIPADSLMDLRQVVGARTWASKEAAAAATRAHDIALRRFDWSAIADGYQAILQ